MSLHTARDALLWCSIINYAVLILWAVLLMRPHGWMYRLWGRWLHLSAEQFDTVNFGAMVLYKVGIILFNLVPCVALWIVA